MAVWIADKAVLSLADDPTTPPLTFYTSGRSRQLEVPGSVVRMANGRLRTQRRAGVAIQLQFAAVALTPDAAATFEAWAGRTVLFRDSWGQKVYGVYFNPATRDFTKRTRRDVTVTLSSVTVDEFAP